MGTDIDRKYSVALWNLRYKGKEKRFSPHECTTVSTVHRHHTHHQKQYLLDGTVTKYLKKKNKIIYVNNTIVAYFVFVTTKTVKARWKTCERNFLKNME